MPTFIKTGFWEKAKKGYKDWLNLDLLIQSLSPTAPYKVYSALLFQDGTTDDPTTTVLENTLGVDITWTRTALGVYQSSVFDPSGTGDCGTNGLKIFTLSGFQNVDSTPISGKILNFYYSTGNCTFQITTVNDDLPPLTADGVLWYTPIEIRLYN